MNVNRNEWGATPFEQICTDLLRFFSTVPFTYVTHQTTSF